MAIDSSTFLEVVRPALEKGDAQALAEAVSKRWHVIELCRLLAHPDTDVRRTAAVTIGFVGDMTNVPCLAQSLKDPDPQVNEMAEHGLWSIWFRGGRLPATRPFREGVAALGREAYSSAIEHFREATRIDPDFAEAYNQRAIAHFFLANWRESIEDCERALKIVPVHFGAACGLGHCHTQLGDVRKALECYRKALKINPRMAPIAKACERIEKRIRELNNSSGMFEFQQIQA